MADLNLESFIKSVEKLASQIEANKNEAKTQQHVASESEKAEQRAAALLTGISNMFDISVQRVEESTTGGMSIICTVGRVELQIVLNQDSRVSDVQVLNSEFRWLDSARLLRSVAAVAPPNDIRQVVSHVASAQRSPEAIQRDLAPYRKVCLVEMRPGAQAAELTLRSGATFVLAFDDCYPEVPGGVTVESLATSSADSGSPEMEALRCEANGLGFSALSQMFSFLENKLAAYC